jgi:hypothetical protein
VATVLTGETNWLHLEHYGLHLLSRNLSTAEGVVRTQVSPSCPLTSSSVSYLLQETVDTADSALRARLLRLWEQERFLGQRDFPSSLAQQTGPRHVQSLFKVEEGPEELISSHLRRLQARFPSHSLYICAV